MACKQLQVLIVTELISCIYYTDLATPDHGMLPPNTAAAVNNVVFGGALAGQFFFGWLGDRLGHKSIYLRAVLFTAICSLMSGSR